jgi:hypothetical protein
MLDFSLTMMRLALILSLVLASAAGPAPFGARAAVHDCCCTASCACPQEEQDEPGCDECGPAAPADEAPSASVLARIAIPVPPALATAQAVVSESVAAHVAVDAPRASGRSLLARLSILRV